ncbi:MAG TPA: glycosyltransferase [Streptosporangiaceae bacterium]|nr:glycosyltransferase [Streptosporangiaceae bacterium]
MAGGVPAELAPVAAGAPSGLRPAGGDASGGFAGAPGGALAEDLSVAGTTTMIETTEILIRPAVSVVVCAFTEDRWEDICRVLGSLRTQTEAPGEIILVIDHCPALLRRARQAFSDITIVPNHFQKGLAGGRNTGVAHAWGDVVAFIDDDAFADPDWLARIADHYLDPTVLGVGGLVEPAWEHGRPGWFPPELDWVVGCSYLGLRSSLGPVRNFIGANMSFRREILAEIGGFSIELGRVDSNPFGCEETELCLRVSQHYPDAILLYEPAAAVSHRVGKQRSRWRYLRSRCYAEGRSKATVASLAGAESALASERSYVRSTIPRGVGRSLWRAARGRPSGLLSAFALVMAVFLTGFGYFVGRRSGRKNAAGVLVAEDTDGEVLDAEAWVLETERTAPDEQIWVLDAEDWLPAVEDWAPGSGLEALAPDDEARALAAGPATAEAPAPAQAPEAPAPGAGRGTVNGHGAARAAEYEMLVAVPEAPPAQPDAPAAEPEVAVAEPEVAVAEPEAAVAEAVQAEPQAQIAEPETAEARPEAAATEPEAVQAEPVALVAEPETVQAEPGTPVAEPGSVEASQPGSVEASQPGVAWWDEPLTPAKPSRAAGTALRTATRASGRVTGLLFPWACLAVVAGLWVSGVNRVQVGAVPTAGFGLLSVLPVIFWAAAALLMVSFCWTVVRWPGRWPALGAHLLVLVVILHATPAIVYGTLRYSWAWKHVGVVDYIIHHGIDFNLGGVLGVYQGWPGFFALNSFLTSDGGLHSALSYAPWALVANDLLWLGPVLLIARAFTTDQRMIWTTAWVFELGNWVGQDYFSPQAYAYFLFLVVIAVCLRWLGDDRPPRRWIRAALAGAAGWARGHAPGWATRRLPAPRAGRRASPRRAPGPALARWMGGHTLPRRAGGRAQWEQAAEGSLWYRVARQSRQDRPDAAIPAEGAGVSRSTRLVLVAALVPLIAAIASSHQLTPVMMVIALGILAVFRHLRPRLLLPLVAAVITVGWIFYGGLDWLKANNSQVFSGFGALWANSSAHIVGGGQVTPDQLIVEWGARLLSAAIGLMAMAGFLRYRRHRDKAARRSWNRVALLGVAAIPMVAGNSYGGEIIFRAFLFALPFMAVAAAALFFPGPWSPRRYLAGAALVVTTAGLTAGYFLSNYGTDAMNYFTPQEVTAAQWLYRTGPSGAQVIAVNSNFPWAFVHYNRYTYTFLDGSGYSSDTLRNPVPEISFLMNPPHPRVSYLVLTRSQAAQEAISGPWSPSQYSRVYSAALQSSDFETVYLAKGVTILRLLPGPGQAAASLGAHPAPGPHRHAVARHRAVLHRHKARPHRSRALIRALRARYRRHHPVTIGGRSKAP